MNFEYAKITRSRLMGSMGLITKYSDENNEVFEYYLLDCEGLGFCDYVRLENPTKQEAYMEEERLMGGLGENRIFISEDRALFLIQYFGRKNLEYEKPLPDGEEYYMNIIENYETEVTMEEMFSILCRKVTSEVEFINFMTMRFIAWDREALRYFCENEETAYMHITNINGTLLKNTVYEKGNGRYISKPIYEDSDGYYVCKIAFNIEKENDEYKVKSIFVTDKQPLYDFQVFDEISKNEFVDIYNLKEYDEFVDKFYIDNPFMMKSHLDEGTFFTRFNFNNNHVKQNVYVINNDLKAVYYVMEDKLYVGTYSKRDRDYINKLLIANYKDYISFDDAMCFEQNVLYDFAESGCDDFYYFIED